MKRIICAALALTLLGSTAAEARDWGGGWHGGHHHGWHGGGAFLGLGLGLLALGTIAAVSEHDRYDDRDRYYRDRDDYYRDRGYDRGYDRGGPREDAAPPPQQHGDYRNDEGPRGDDRGSNDAPRPLHGGDNGDD